MPILAENRHRYPKNWKQIREGILQRAFEHCEFCGVRNYSLTPKGGKVVLTVAHLDHQPENNDQTNLKALCQSCHNKHDMPHRLATRARRHAIKKTGKCPDCLKRCHRFAKKLRCKKAGIKGNLC